MPKNKSRLLIFLLIFLLVCLPLVVSSCFLLDKDPPVWPDEAIMVDTAKTFLQTGKLATNIFGPALPSLGQHALWYPPLYFYVLAGLIKIFGAQIETVRLLSFILAILTLFLVVAICELKFKNHWCSLVCGLLISGNIYFGEAARVARMDMLSFFLLILTTYLFFKAQKKDTYSYYFFVGVSCLLSLLTHPFGFIALTTICIYLLFTADTLPKKLAIYMAILLPVAVGGCWYFWSIRNLLPIFFNQYALQFARKAVQTPSVYTFFGANTAGLLLLVVYSGLAIGLAFDVIKHRSSFSLYILTGLIVATLVIIWGKESWYLVYFQAYIPLALTGLFFQSGQHKTNIKYLLFLVAIGLFLSDGYTIWSTIRLTYTWQYNPFIAQIIDRLPEQGTIFLAIIPDPYFDFPKDSQLTIREFLTVPVPLADYQKLLDESDYMLVDFRYITLNSDAFLKKYIKLNAAAISLATNQTDGPIIVTLRPRNERVISYEKK